MLGVAALAMVGTLPGRTQGLGLITEPLLADLGIGRVAYALINFIATTAGALFCIGVGRAIDRRGSRVVLTILAVALGASVLATSGVSGAVALLILVTLTRGVALLFGLAPVAWLLDRSTLYVLAARVVALGVAAALVPLPVGAEACPTVT